MRTSRDQSGFPQRHNRKAAFIDEASRYRLMPDIPGGYAALNHYPRALRRSLSGSHITMAFVVDIASSPDRDEVVAEIWWNDQMVAEIRQGADGNRYLDVYPSPSRTPWSFRLADWLDALKEAESRLR
jgi:hypothetical protein